MQPSFSGYMTICSQLSGGHDSLQECCQVTELFEARLSGDRTLCRGQYSFPATVLKVVSQRMGMVTSGCLEMGELHTDTISG